MSQEMPYNPLHKKNLGTSVANALLARPPEPLAPAPFVGAGIYAIYYRGDYRAYAAIAERNRNEFNLPIYVGKAIPAGARKGGLGLDAAPGLVLYKRLAEHADSIRFADNLRLEDFHCRYLTVEDIWIPLGESLLIEKFSPLWNRVIDGFGNHDPGAGRYQQMRAAWDILHPGRPWAIKCRDGGRSEAMLLAQVLKHENK
jgi:Eco29kI restriction endonuclease